MFRLLSKFIIALVIYITVEASSEGPVSVISVYKYNAPPNNPYQMFFNEFSSNYYPQCFDEVLKLRGPHHPPAPTSLFNPEVFPFFDISVRDVFYSPIYVAVKSLTVPDRFDIHFASKGFYSIFNEPQFKSVKMYLLTPTAKSAVAFHARNFFNFKIFNFKINSFIGPDDYSFGDFVKTINNVHRIPIFAIFDKYDFESFHLDYIYESGKIGVYEHYVEPIFEAHSEKVKVRP